MKTVTPKAAIEAIPEGSRVILPHGCVEPSRLYEAFAESHERFRALRLYSGLQFGDYPFLRAGLGESFQYATWQASPRLRPLFREGRIDVLPLRFRDITRVVRRGGALPPDVVFIQVTPPRQGQVSLGISVSLFRELAANADLVIAEINPNMPWTAGSSAIPVEQIALCVDSDEPLGTYRSARRTPRDERIADHVLGLIPRQAWVQLGIGAIPELVLERLHELEEVNLHSGMLTDALVRFVGQARHRARVVTGEVCGGPELYRLLNDEPRIELHPSSVTHDLLGIAKLPRFVSINSAVEIDLHGQVNGETIDGVQISGVGGALDFVEGAAYSPGGLSIIALPSTTENGRYSKIVAQLGTATPVTIPRFCADYVVTEHGVAHLRGKTLRERAEALTALASPPFRSQLARAASL